MATHKCPVFGCDEQCAPGKLMCWRHWRLVPAEMQREVYRTYRAYYACPITPVDKFAEVNRARIDAATAAITAAFERERA